MSDWDFPDDDAEAGLYGPGRCKGRRWPKRRLRIGFKRLLRGRWLWTTSRLPYQPDP
jgi:hypothetical protein